MTSIASSGVAFAEPGPDEDSSTCHGRGCVFFNFGEACALRLLVSIWSLRQHYGGPITTFLARDAAAFRLHDPLKELGSGVIFDDAVSKSWDRHRLFSRSPYTSTLVLDSDLVFLAPIDDLWAPLEREGVLVTRFFPPLYGIDGTTDSPRGRLYRMRLFDNVRHLLDRDTCNRAIHRLVDKRIDINVGVMGISRPKGDAFLADWSEHMRRGRGGRIMVLDEMLVLALVGNHRHFLADEIWNCPADEFFRRTNLADARIIHYFGDGHTVRGIRLGRNPRSWAGRKWIELYRAAADQIDLQGWEAGDPGFPRRRRLIHSERLGRALRRIWSSTGQPRDLPGHPVERTKARHSGSSGGFL